MMRQPLKRNHPMFHRRKANLALLAAWICSTVAFADDGPADRRTFAVTDPAEADADYDLQGEYIGSVSSTRCGCETAGLQVIALGDGLFQATKYRGGLPGAGWDQSPNQRLQGQRQEDVLALGDEETAILIERGFALVSDTSGCVLGRLQKIHRLSPTVGARPPCNSLVLFDGSTPVNLQDASVTDDGLLAPGASTATPVRDFQMHLEFRTPYMPYARGQARGNSGVYIQRRYEVQILDSFGLEGEANECGGLYKQRRPDLNMCLPPLAWQTYDIYFTAARWRADGAKIANARITVLHNAVAVHDGYELTDKTGAGRPEGPEDLPIHFQDHGNPVRFRNIWIVAHEEEAQYCCQYEPRRKLVCRPLLLRRCGGPLRRWATR